MSENENQEDYFKDLIELLKKLKEDFQIHGRLMNTAGIAPKLFKEFRIIFKQTSMAGDEYFEMVDWPKSPELMEAEQKKRELAESKRVEPLPVDRYAEALRLEKKDLSFAQIAKFQGMDEGEFRKRYLKALERHGSTQLIVDKIERMRTQEGEQDYVLKVITNPYSKPESILLKLNPVRVLLKQGLKPKAIAERLSLNFDSFKTWLPANEKYLNL